MTLIAAILTTLVAVAGTLIKTRAVPQVLAIQVRDGESRTRRTPANYPSQLKR